MNDDFSAEDARTRARIERAEALARVRIDRARAVEATFRVQPGLYLIGSLERGVTVYNQQLRAHNLVWALWELRKEMKIDRVAIVGGGIAGLTAAACFLSRFDRTVSVTVFEQLWDLCPLQQGADNRWLHPKIYEWPAHGSRAPGASLPVLNWSEGRASDVARTIVGEFSEFCKAFAKPEDRLSVLLGLRHFRINVARKEIDWVANRAKRAGAFFHIGEAEGDSAVFDIIVLAAGFGLETLSPEYPTNSYWRNEQLGQPALDGTRQNFLVSGFGDGALIDLCRLTIERYRQDTILYELFRRDLEQVEERFAEAWRQKGSGANAFEVFLEFEEDFKQARIELSNRIRKDTRVTLHISGKRGDVKTFSQIFGPYSSFLNRMMVFLLYRCGAFSISFADLETAVVRNGIPRTNVLCRYGADPLAHLRAMFVDVTHIEARLTNLKECQEQKPQRFWEPGTFPHYSVKEGLLKEDNLVDATSLINKLKDKTNQLANYLCSRFTDGTRQLLDQNTVSDQPDKELLEALVKELNTLLKGTSLYEVEQFKQVQLSEETRKQIEQQPQGEELIRLNRLLIEDAYPYEIAQNRKG